MKASDLAKLTRRTEHQEAVKLAEWMRLKGLFFMHVANEGKRHPAIAMKLKREGMIPGSPDYLILTKTKQPFIRGIAVELKKPKVKRGTKTQEQFIEQLIKEGWAAKVCSGADDAIAFVESFFR